MVDFPLAERPVNQIVRPGWCRRVLRSGWVREWGCQVMLLGKKGFSAKDGGGVGVGWGWGRGEGRREVYLRRHC